MDVLFITLLSAVCQAIGAGVWWLLRKALVVREELSSGAAEVLGGVALAGLVGLVVVALLVF